MQTHISTAYIPGRMNTQEGEITYLMIMEESFSARFRNP
jgi:hypothetical protein